MSVLFGRDIGDQVVERPRLLATTEVERLEGIVHQGATKIADRCLRREATRVSMARSLLKYMFSYDAMEEKRNATHDHAGQPSALCRRQGRHNRRTAHQPES